ncbi:cellulose synthase catalytic subunit [Pseudofrankia sp. DC12]|uniref:glycosyltransferase family 2 protein n=1 Tax=Pseudofrankia sp. DC12 TaxID=683315 RepID=UPI0005F7EE8E|nr:cellulose synthase catalytic subunit [Pseudofrankia sp. DC12]
MTYDYATFSTLAGTPTLARGGSDYRVAYRRVMVGRELRQVLPLLVVTLGLSSLFFVWLIQPQHYPDGRYLPTGVRVGNAIMFWLIVVTEGIRLLNSITLCWSSVIMRNPIPVLPMPGLRVAFTTTIVPSKEPLDVVRDTLIAARNIQYERPIDVWLLDEGDDPAVRAMCEEIGVRHFSRKGVAEWNTSAGPFRAKTKHGNHNSWLAAHGDDYDVVLSVDPDHIPLPNFADRMLGYFRDRNVAFVVGPQVYGNFRHYLTRGAEAQNYMFHSVIQRAANRFASGMFVGTNHAYRVATWRQIGGFQDSITEDLATSLAVHSARNPDTNHRWTSVYTPDVVAVGEGPASWTDFFNQQLRWARGSNEVMVTDAPRRLKALDWGPRLHYLTLMLHYPTIAITWILGMALTIFYMALGSTGVVVHVSAWLALYIDVFLARLLLYFWLRRFNISPHEEKGSAGMSGIFVSVLCTPFYSSALIGALLRRKLGFVVTPKGRAASPDHLLTFRKHLFWAAISAGSIIAAASLGHIYPANLVWASLSLLTCVIPIALWLVEPVLAPRRAKSPNPLPSAHIPRQRVDPTRPTGAPAAPGFGTGTTDATGPLIGPLPQPPALLPRTAGLGETIEAPDDTGIAHVPAIAAAADRRAATGPQPVIARGSDLVDAGVPAGVRPIGVTAQDERSPTGDTAVTARPGEARPEDALPAPEEPALPSPSTTGGLPIYTEDVTLVLHPRRRRVSLDGQLEEIT